MTRAQRNAKAALTQPSPDPLDSLCCRENGQGPALFSVHYGASRAPKDVGPRHNSPTRPAEQLRVRHVLLGFRAPVRGPAHSPDGSPLQQVLRNGGGAGITRETTPPPRCKGGALRVKARPAPPRNELEFCFWLQRPLNQLYPNYSHSQPGNSSTC